MHFSLITVPQTEWRSGPSPASHQLDDPWTLSSLSLQWRMGEHWQHPSSGFINSMHWPNWMIYMKRLWKLWGAIPMYVIIIFLTKFVILSVNEILICSSNTLLWLCLSYTYENAWVYPAGNVSYGVCLFIFNIMTSIQNRFQAAQKDTCTISRYNKFKNTKAKGRLFILVPKLPRFGEMQ